MVDIQTIAIGLLLGRLISVVFISLVLTKQFRLFGTKINFGLVPNLSKYERRNIYRIRRILFALSVVIFVGNMVPVFIDFLTIISSNSIGRNPTVPIISIAYGISNSLTAAFSALMIWALYKLAGFGGEKK